MVENPKEKLEYLEHEDVETMDKKTSELRKEEAEEEIERISSLKPKEAEAISGTSPKIPTGEENKKPFFKKPSLLQKVSIRIFYTLIIFGIIGLIYWLIKK